MPEWVWMLCLFAALTFGYVTGFLCGFWKSEADGCPSDEAYLRKTEILSDANKAIEMHKIDMEYQERMRMKEGEKQ